MIKRLLLLSVVGALAVGGWLVYFSQSTLALPQTPFGFELKPGTTLKGVSRQLTAAGLLKEPWTFTLLVRALGKAGDIKAGNYLLEKNLTVLELFRMITTGDVRQNEIKFIEGWNFKQLREALDANPNLVHDTVGLPNAEVLRRLGFTEPHPEGLFFPDTYYFTGGMSDLAILRRAHGLMQEHLARAWEERAPNLPYATPYEALIMASIVEKETGAAVERPMIAGVFINRLKIGMRLQTDPTVIYGMGEGFDGNIRKRDLSADTPYNTYTRAGLPPTPIAMPGLGALQAALQPAQTKALYFVSKGNGTHQFSASLDEHNRAVARYQK
ncbi:MAG: endolytic transglycosylase MltG [Chloroflexi bacterium]|nr:endolytic transglycosylase MltG [Chloroflexota bacterium]